ncbi:MAG: hypothetical protein ACM30G_06155 [Micromonosporaceae bacterium]
MAFDSDALAAELKFLRRGRAMRHPGILRRLGPQTRRLAGIGNEANSATARTAMAVAIEELLRSESAETRLAVLGALALHPQTDQRDLTARERWLAGQLNCHERTARRRVDEAFDVLVLVATERAQADRGHTDLAERSIDDAWQLRTVRGFLRLDGPTPDLTEQSSIVVTGDQVSEIVFLFTVPRVAGAAAADHDLVVEMLFGGRIGRCERASDEHFRILVELPRTYRRGETHEYAIRYQIPPGQPMAPHYLLQPSAPCLSFDVTVRFNLAAPPATVWRLDGVDPRGFDVPASVKDLLLPDRFGDVQLSFRQLRQDRAYGVKWS